MNRCWVVAWMFVFRKKEEKRVGRGRGFKKGGLGSVGDYASGQFLIT
jgi:hypothetical protein